MESDVEEDLMRGLVEGLQCDQLQGHQLSKESLQDLLLGHLAVAPLLLTGLARSAPQ